MIKTQNAPIRGFFLSSGLLLTTSNASIYARTMLTSEDDGSTSRVTMLNTNGCVSTCEKLASLSVTPADCLDLDLPLRPCALHRTIDNQLMLLSNTPTGTGGIFRIDAGTTNAMVNLAFVREIPVDSRLDVSAHTTDALANVQLPSAYYEGTFQLVSSAQSPPSVDWDEAAADPARRGRQRSVIVERAAGVVNGSVAWDEDGRKRGHVAVGTTNASAYLSF